MNRTTWNPYTDEQHPGVNVQLAPSPEQFGPAFDPWQLRREDQQQGRPEPGWHGLWPEEEE